jgi:hypothetical protein
VTLSPVFSLIILGRVKLFPGLAKLLFAVTKFALQVFTFTLNVFD